MPELLKNYFNRPFLEDFAGTVTAVVPHFDKQQFLHQIFDEHWDQRELKQRMRHIAIALHDGLSGSYDKDIAAIIQIIRHIQQKGKKEFGIEYMFLPDYIEVYGLDHLESSQRAMEFITQFTSCEFAVRPFIKKYPEAMMAKMLAWSAHPHHFVRRFASEGCRPRLPWAMALPALKKDPAPIIPILENLKNDPSEFVRRSVANNLNDISKDNPDLVMQIVNRWQGSSRETDWIIKHGCRTLLRKAHDHTLSVFGFSSAVLCEIANLSVEPPQIRIGDALHFSFQLISKEKQPVKYRVEYAVDFVKSNGKHSRKLFKITENTFQPNTPYPFKRTQRFHDLTTRKHYPGKHQLGILINGNELAKLPFTLLEQE